MDLGRYMVLLPISSYSSFFSYSYKDCKLTIGSWLMKDYGSWVKVLQMGEVKEHGVQIKDVMVQIKEVDVSIKHVTDSLIVIKELHSFCRHHSYGKILSSFQIMV